MPPKDKMAAQAAAKKIEDKTFGMKNKNKSKQVQQTIAQMKASAGMNDKRKVKAARATPSSCVVGRLHMCLSDWATSRLLFSSRI